MGVVVRIGGVVVSVRVLGERVEGLVAEEGEGGVGDEDGAEDEEEGEYLWRGLVRNGRHDTQKEVFF